MSLENDVQLLTKVIAEQVKATVALTEVLIQVHRAAPPIEAQPVSVATLMAQAPVSVAPPPPAMPPLPFPGTPVASAPVFVPPAAVAPVFVPPAAPVFAPPPAAVAVPFTDVQGAVNWVVSRYQALGPRGGEIQNVLAAMGLSSITAVQPAQFAELFQRVSALG